MKEIVLIRHAESQANAGGVWNGQAEGPLSQAGEASLDALGKRLADQEFDVVVSSPLSRARRTAEAFADEVHIDDAFTEIHLGRWEGMRLTEVKQRYGEELARAFATRTEPMGETGESLADLERRALGAVDALFESLGESQRAAVVTHGGLLQAVLRRHLRPAPEPARRLVDGDAPRVHAFTANTGISRLVWQYGAPRLATFNDLAHLGPRSALVDSHLARGNPIIALVRHGQTRANVERRWQGHGDWDLDDQGRAQSAALAGWYGQVPLVYSSPLRRARSTAEYLATDGVIEVEGLKELAMGRWEGLTTEEIVERWPGMMETIYRHGVDLKRGETGESWGELTARISATVGGIRMSTSEPTVAVAHGGAIRAYVSSLTETRDTHAESLLTPYNTAVTHVALTETGPEILDYAVAAHLEPIK